MARGIKCSEKLECQGNFRSALRTNKLGLVKIDWRGKEKTWDIENQWGRVSFNEPSMLLLNLSY
jgi:hypothetical protein